MSKWDKLLSRVHKLSKDIRFREVCKIMDSYGYEMKDLAAEVVITPFAKGMCSYNYSKG